MDMPSAKGSRLSNGKRFIQTAISLAMVWCPIGSFHAEALCQDIFQTNPLPTPKSPSAAKHISPKQLFLENSSNRGTLERLPSPKTATATQSFPLPAPPQRPRSNPPVTVLIAQEFRGANSEEDDDLLAPSPKNSIPSTLGKGSQRSPQQISPSTNDDEVFQLAPPTGDVQSRPNRQQAARMRSPAAPLPPPHEGNWKQGSVFTPTQTNDSIRSPSDLQRNFTEDFYLAPPNEKMLPEANNGLLSRPASKPVTPMQQNAFGIDASEFESWKTEKERARAGIDEPSRSVGGEMGPSPSKPSSVVAPDIPQGAFEIDKDPTQRHFTEAMPWHPHGDVFTGTKFGSLYAQPSPSLRNNSNYGMNHESLRLKGFSPSHTIGWDPNPVAENRPTIAPVTTLPDRLESRHWQFQQNRELPFNSSTSPEMDRCIRQVPYQPSDFAPNPQQPQPLDACREIQTYYGKSLVETQRPWVEWWRPFYTGGMYEPGIPVFSDVNLLTPSFLVYGDYRTGVGIHQTNGKDIRNWAHRLNLDMDLRLTGTERFHLFTGPLDHNGRFTRLDFSDNPVEFEEELDFQPDTAFFEGDLGAITGGMIGDDAPFDLPFTCGLVPLLYQNGIWMEDAILGFAVGSPWRHSRPLNWANYEMTFFAGFNQITSPAFNNDNSAAAVYGTAWFIEAYNGYIEIDYAYLDDLDNRGRSYHNAAIAYTRRYWGRISNTVRLLGNAGQSGPIADRTADGGLLLFENSLISSQPSNVVPYWNLFVGSGRPQSVARAGNAGDILRNTGINFEIDGLTSYPTLTATGSNSYGGATGINLLSADFRRQMIFEFSAVDPYGNEAISKIAGTQYAIGSRYQRAINNRSLWRIDFIKGWLEDAPDLYGTRAEFRWKF